ncbi:UDP-4-amino-4,6-dideoxy-N-acetyl-beta-L-altrosamine transaminase [Leptospira noguchii]|uniref:UDP-4-amino-4, 6-dideoxy-N-acetyl-beta-L-altrosamine transaminase n=1 Tax=Leptospira noguchii TaxID=28182 RepID=UPI001F062447|nr:UDP-4-amino-4,6-dideoxy-N-acetyl-beta-L-altrosamine transaminase [Leptospira noguchii]MCH1913326.1 UDP-4-amino-4,6-dideoxy-N-acetyl-beta-L-altrosamine transaminase [Leptospira noguchii]MCH1915411.1 UDP-4-amino-4,6-dideoxy-N-acetyl-beta-L-altrosamine transaminase [Leptospira noguchii]
MIPYGKQSISEEDIEAVIKILRSDFLTQGPAVPQFESAVCTYTGARFGIATNSATSALHIACLALEVGPGDRVWTSPISFVASANCGLYCGASVDFVDIDPKTYNMSVDCLKEKLEKAEIEGTLPKVVIPVHLAGQSSDMEAIHTLSKKYNFKIIEDASHAIGGAYKGRKIGSCEFSDISVFSFHPVKIITTGEGGMAVTNDSELVNKMYRLRSHGITRTPAEMTRLPEGQWYYQQLELGYNYRLTDIQAALGSSQMNRLDEFVSRRQVIRNYYDEILRDLPVVTPYQNKDCYSAFHLYIIRIDKKKMAASHREIFERFRSSGIMVNLHYIPIYRQPYYEQFKYDITQFPESEKYYSEAISLPMFPGLTSKELDFIKSVLITPIGHQTLF